jgi:hypothetical protein
VFCTAADEKWGSRFDGSTRLLSFWAVSDGSVIFLAGYDVVPPVISNVINSTTSYNFNVTVNAKITDGKSAVQDAILSYSIWGRWHNVTMVSLGELYAGEIPPTRYGSLVLFKLFASDSLGNWRTTNISAYSTTDFTPPDVGFPEWTPKSPLVGQSVLVKISASEPELASGIRFVILYYSFDDKTLIFKSLAMTLKNGTWSSFIPALNASGKVTFFIQAFDKAGNIRRTRNYSYTVVDTDVPQSPLPTLIISVTLAIAIAGTAVYLAKRRKTRGKTAKKIEKFSPSKILFVPSGR